jgi:hypothetical protein
MKGYRFLLTYFVLVLLLIVALLFSSCATKVITVPEVRTEYVVKTDSFVKKDSIYINDSVFIREKGDTVWVEKFKTIFKDRIRMVVERDTFMRCDTISQVIEVEKPLTWWQEKKIEFGELAMVVMVGLLVFVVLKLKFR